MIERLNMFKSQFGYDEPMDPIDESSYAWKMYKDFVVPPLPPAYAHLNLPPHWLLHMFCKKNKKRSHKKSEDAVMSFKDLAMKIADGYKKVDDETKAWLDELCSKLLAYNKAMRDDLAAFLAENGGGEAAADEDDAADEEAEEDSRQSSPRNVILPSQISQDLLANERKRYLLQLHAAKLSLEMQELQKRRTEVIDRYGLSPHHGPSLASHLTMQGGHRRSMLPLPASGAWIQPNPSQMPEAGSLLNAEASRKRNQDRHDEGTNSNRKKSKITTLLDEEKVVRAASLDGLTRDSLGSAFNPRLPFNQALALGSETGPANVANQHNHLMLGYQLGLRAAAQAQARAAAQARVRALHADMQRLPIAAPRLTNDEIAARLDELEREAMSRKSGSNQE